MSINNILILKYDILIIIDMRNQTKHILFVVFVSMISEVLYANEYFYDIEVDNSDGVTIYYRFINDNTELEVTNPNITHEYSDFFQTWVDVPHDSGYSGIVNIPSTVYYFGKTYNVTRIGYFAFYQDRWYADPSVGVTSVIIPNSVKSIGWSAFSRCTDLTSVTIPNSVTIIDGHAFEYCTGLTSVTIPNSVTYIGECVFEGCTGLTSVTLPNNLDWINLRVFSCCSSLTSVTIPNSVTNIDRYAFEYCTGLTSVTIPNNVKYIRYNAFDNCSGLKTVTIGKGVREIQGNAFTNCNNLTKVISLIEYPFDINGESSSEPVFSTNTFRFARLFVPVGTFYKYKATQGWKDFVRITEGIPSGIGEVKTEVDKTEVSRYTLDGKKLFESQKGINILKMSDGTTRKVMVK